MNVESKTKVPTWANSFSTVQIFKVYHFFRGFLTKEPFWEPRVRNPEPMKPAARIKSYFDPLVEPNFSQGEVNVFHRVHRAHWPQQSDFLNVSEGFLHAWTSSCLFFLLFGKNKLLPSCCLRHKIHKYQGIGWWSFCGDKTGLQFESILTSPFFFFVWTVQIVKLAQLSVLLLPGALL